MIEDKKQRAEAIQFHAHITRLKQPDLEAIAIAIDINPKSHNRATLIVAVMHKAGYKMPTQQEIQDRPRETYSPEQVHAFAKRYILDEIQLMRACASMLETLYALYDSTDKPRLEEALGELSYYRNHSNLGRLSTLQVMLRGAK